MTARSQTEPPRPPFALIAAITVTGVMGNTLISPAIPDIRDDFGLSNGMAGVLVAAAALPGVFLAPLIGVLADRFGRREVVVPCLVTFGLAGGLAAFAPSFTMLLACRLVQGAGAAGLVNLAVVIIGDNWDGLERTRMIGRNSAALLSSIVVLPPIGGLLAEQWGWRATFTVYWVALATAVAVVLGVPRSPRSEVRITDQLRATAPYIRSREVLGPVTVAFLAFTMIFGLFLTVMPVYLDDRFGVSAGWRGLVLALPAVTSTLGSLWVARLASRFGLRRTLALACSLWVGAFAVIAGVPVLAVLCLAVLVYGFGEGLLIPTLQDAVASAAPASSRGATVALFVAFARAGQSTGPLLAGLGMTTVGPRGTFAAGVAVAAAMTAAQPFLLTPKQEADQNYPGSSGRSLQEEIGLAGEKSVLAPTEG